MVTYILSIGPSAGVTTSKERAEEYARQNPLYQITEFELDAKLAERWELPWGSIDCFEEKPPVDTGPVLVQVPDFMSQFNTKLR